MSAQIFAGERTDVRGGIGRVAHAPHGDTREEEALEFAPDAAHDNEAFRGDAALTGIGEPGLRAGFRGEFEVALAETAHHFQLFMRRTAEPPADADFRVLTCGLGANVADAPADCLADTDWKPGQRFGRAMRASGIDGIRYSSLRYPEGTAAAIFWPDCLSLPITQNQQLRYRWDGARMTHYLPHGATAWTIWPIDGIA